jgi:L-ascorbate metabolism protein UlaG (beta-lactamase superfamily)
MLFRISSYYKGQKTEHFDGRRFHTPWQPFKHSWWDFFRWVASASPKSWPESVDDPHFDMPPQAVEGNDLRVSFVGHSTVLIQTQGLNILTDPIWAEWPQPFKWKRSKRICKPGIHFENLPKIDVILVSHNHYDHLDVITIQKIWRRDRPIILTPLGNDAVIQAFDRSIPVETLDWEHSKKIHGRLTIHLQPSQHWSARGVWDINKALWGAFVLETEGGNIYFAGDTGYGKGDHFRKAKEKFGKFRLALLPIGAYEPRWLTSYAHMDPEESVRAHLSLGQPLSMAIHFGTFRLSDEGYEDPVRALATAKNIHSVPDRQFRALQPGEYWKIP